MPGEQRRDVPAQHMPWLGAPTFRHAHTGTPCFLPTPTQPSSLAEPLRGVDFRPLAGSEAPTAYPTCHAHTSCPQDEFDLLVGTSSGEGAAECAAGAASGKAAGSARRNGLPVVLRAGPMPPPTRAWPLPHWPHGRRSGHDASRPPPLPAPCWACCHHRSTSALPPLSHVHPAVVGLSLEQQLRAGPSNFKPVSSLSFNAGGCTNASRCVSVAWLPGPSATSFMVAHRWASRQPAGSGAGRHAGNDGCAAVRGTPGCDMAPAPLLRARACAPARRDGGIYVYHKITASSSEPRLLARSGSQSGVPSSALTRVQAPGTGGGLAAAAPSPDGRHLAAACKDGRLRIYELGSGHLVAGFQARPGGTRRCS